MNKSYRLRYKLIALMIGMTFFGSMYESKTMAIQIVILVHGVGSSGIATSPDYSYAQTKTWIEANFKNVSVIDFDWSEGTPDHPLHASIRVGHRADQIHGMSDRAWAGAAKLKELVARIRSLPQGPTTSITIIAHSQGTVLTLCALQEGMQVENVVFMGSPLFQHIVADEADDTSLARAAENVSQWFVNLSSPQDTVIDTLLPNLRPLAKGGCIGSRGLPHTIKGLAEPAVKTERFTEWNLKNGSTLTCVKLSEVEHNGEKGWWRFHWLDEKNQRMWPESIIPKKFIERLELANATENNLDLTKVKEFAASSDFMDNTRFGFGSGREFDEAEWTFTLTKGMATGFHFDDKRVLEFSIEVLEGEIDRSVLHATWYTWEEGHGLPAKRIDSAQGMVAETFESQNFALDATLWLKLDGISEIARVKVKATARMYRGSALPKVW